MPSALQVELANSSIALDLQSWQLSPLKLRVFSGSQPGSSGRTVIN